MTAQIPNPRPQGAAIANLDPFFRPDAPPLPDPEPMPDAMQQNPYILHVMQILADLLTERLNTFVDTKTITKTIVYYDPADRNRRFQPDVYVAFGVDPQAIRQRNGYLIWEVGKPPDFVLEVASESTASSDTGRKRDLYAELGIPEYWRFDASGGAMYGAALSGEYLDNGIYQPFPINNAPDGATWGYSPLLGLNLRWRDQWLELQDPHTGEILLDRRGVRLAMEAVQQERNVLLRENEEYQELVDQLREQLQEQRRSPE